jgi:selenocysteine-specific elongation factor
VRGLQSHGEPRERIEPGSRCAVNLQGVEVGEIERGQVVTAPGALAPTRCLDVEVSWLGRVATSIQFLVGAAERVGKIAPIGVGFARIHLEGEVVCLPGDRFVLRGFSRGTVGGGVVLDVAPPRRRRSDPALLRELEALSRRDPGTEVAVRVERAGFAGVAEEALRRETGLEGRAGIVKVGDRWLSEAALHELERRVVLAVREFHECEPLRPGIPRAALRGALPENAPPAVLDLLLGSLVVDGDLARLPEHRPRLSPDEQSAVDRLRRESAAAGLEPPTLREWSERLGHDVRPLLAHLEREGSLVRAPGDLWFDRGAVDDLRRRVVEWIRANGPLDTPGYKKLIGTTRKHAVPLMELFDAEQVTLRRGETRILRRA